MSVEHYENFPVASLLLPPRLRPAVHAVYRFARSADDIADEGQATPEQRLAQLGHYREQLQRVERGEPGLEPLFETLKQAVQTHRLPMQPFYDLLSAFEQDVNTQRYASYASLRDYCRRSANPVGRLMLALYEHADAESLQQSDAICSALQLINFLQDVAIDLDKQRIYLPEEDLQAFGVTPEQLQARRVDTRWRALMAFEVERARALMHSGAPLARRLPGRAGWELRLVVQGGLRILSRIESADYDVFRRRPQLGKRDYLVMLARALRM